MDCLDRRVILDRLDCLACLEGKDSKVDLVQLDAKDRLASQA